jgi:hypothetical protein
VEKLSWEQSQIVVPGSAGKEGGRRRIIEALAKDLDPSSREEVFQIY